MIHIIFFSLFIFKIFAVDLIKAKECVTPYNEKATCSAISDCYVIKSALLSLTPQAIQFVKDSQCSCDAGMVCCGTSNDKYYQQLFNCVPVPEPLNIFSSNVSSSSVCGLDSSTDRIKGGSLVKAEEHPWLAAIEYKNKHTKKNAGIRCGGSLITERFVLTAAHCIVDVEFEIIKVWLGASNISSEEICSNDNGIITCIKSVKKLNVAKTIPHECYNSINKYNDIGLLELEADLKLSAYIRPICIPSHYSNSLSIGTSLTVIGWGATENGKKSDVKLKVQVPMRGNKICEDYLKKCFRTITSNQLCAGGERGKDSCEGDSGGPLMLEVVGVNDDVQWIQMGIVSYGIGCGLEEKPGVYIKVSAYEDWIRNKVTNNAYEDSKPCMMEDHTI